MSDLLFEVTYLDLLGKKHQKTVLAKNSSWAEATVILTYNATLILKVEEIR